MPNTDSSPAANTALKTALVLCANRDKVAFTQLYQLAAPKLFGVIMRIVQNKAFAEEVLQEVFITIWNHAHDYDPHRAEPLAWLCTIARNRALDGLRRQQPNVELTDEMAAIIASPEAGPEALYLASDQARALHQCLSQLEATQRNAVVLAYFQDLSHSELAQRLKVPLGTIKTWTRRGLDKLRTCMGKQS